MSKRSFLLLVLVIGLFAAIGLGGCSTQAKNPLPGSTPSEAQSAAPSSQPRDSKESAPTAAKSNAGETAGLHNP